MTSLWWPTVPARAVSVGHSSDVAPARWWLPCSRPRTLLIIIRWPIAGSGWRQWMLGSLRFNRRWNDRCMGRLVPDCRDLQGHMSYSLSNASYVLVNSTFFSGFCMWIGCLVWFKVVIITSPVAVTRQPARHNGRRSTLCPPVTTWSLCLSKGVGHWHHGVFTISHSVGLVRLGIHIN